MKMQRLGIDLSEHNGDFKSSRLDDFEFVMIRTGYGSINKDAHNFTVPKRCVSVREPYSAERRKAASERAKAAGYQPPVRKSGS